MIFTPLHINTEYSFGKSLIRIDKLIAKAKAIGLKKLLITDKNNLFGVSEFIYKCKKNNIKPIIGIELDVENFQLILIAKNYEGFVHLNELSSKKMYGEEIKKDDINYANIFIIDHPKNGCYYKNNVILDFENFWIGSNDPKNTNEIFVQEGVFLEKEDYETLEFLYKMNKDETDISNVKSLNFEIENKNWYQVIESLTNECNFEFPKNLKILPKFPNREKITSNQYLKKILTKNFKEKLADVSLENREVYLKRIKYEIEIIEKLKFEDYFLIIWDLIKWAKEQKIIIGPGRGSSSGSLVSYILDITEIDPIKYNLFFERFLNPKRSTMPDIDIDIQDNRRNEVLKYLFDKYGAKNVGLISTFSRLGAKSAIRDVARYFKVPMRDVNILSKLIPNDLDLKQAYEEKSNFRALINSSSNNQRIFKLAQKIEGLPRQFSTHAAGIVISDENLNNKIATIKGNENFNQIQSSMDHLEDFKLLKIDLLGLRNLTIIQRIQEEIFKNENKKVFLSKIPLNDQKTLKLLSSGRTNGVFQLESYGMKKTLIEVGVDSFDDIVAIISLFRPGPIDNIKVYASRKNNNATIEKVSKDFDQITKNTFGIIVYQEQIIEIAQKISGMTHAEADILRRAIGKKEFKLINSLKERFINGAINKGYSQKESIKIYNLIEKFADYGFNKSHAVAYGKLSYWMGFLKARFKFEFYTALLDYSISSQTTLKRYINEAKEEQIEVISPSINLSQEKVVNQSKKIILPLQIIKGFGFSANNKLLEERKKGQFKDFFDFVSRVKHSGLGESMIELLIKTNTLREFGNMQSLLDSLPSALRYSNMVTIEEKGQLIIDKNIISKPKLIISERNISDEIFNEKKLFGFQLNAFLTSSKENENKLINLKLGEIKEIVFLVEKIIKINTKNNQKMAKIIISDSTTSVDLIVFPQVYKFIEFTKEKSIVKGLIKCSVRNQTKTFILERQWKEF